MNTIILMAGTPDNVFMKSCDFPRYLYEIRNKPLIQRILESIVAISSNVVCVVRKEDQEKFYLGDSIKILCPKCSVIEISGETAGALCSALFAIEKLDINDELLILNGDQFVKKPIIFAIKDFRERQLDGGIITFNSVNPRFSSVLLDDKGFVVETSEKKPISSHASTGVTYFRRTEDFISCAYDVIKKDMNCCGRYYISSVYNELILRSNKIGIYEILKKDYLNLSELERFNLNLKSQLNVL